ncbi:MAG: SMC-Scp complex subunit ScpB [Capsulimonadaceae bacterium]|nr:SMC-Scp complex subunit ScpB [Capsulimonadaceae bacterium]
MKDLIEACLFLSTEPVSSGELARIFAWEPTEVDMICNTLVEEYEERAGGVIIVRVAGGFQMVTRPDLSEQIARFLAGPNGRARLSKPALETVAIVAYRQPITTAEIEAIRGVNADGVLRTLLDRKLVKEGGRKVVPGRPILYVTTPDFLHYFGLNALEDLPPLDEVMSPEEDRAAMMQEVEAAVGLTAQEETGDLDEAGLADA